MFKPAILKCPTGKYMWVGTIYAEIDGLIFNSREEAQKAWDKIEQEMI